MTTYKYTYTKFMCSKCLEEFMILQSIPSHQEEARCPKCHSMDVKKTMCAYFDRHEKLSCAGRR